MLCDDDGQRYFILAATIDAAQNILYSVPDGGRKGGQNWKNQPMRFAVFVRVCLNKSPKSISRNVAKLWLALRENQ